MKRQILNTTSHPPPLKLKNLTTTKTKTNTKVNTNTNTHRHLARVDVEREERIVGRAQQLGLRLEEVGHLRWWSLVRFEVVVMMVVWVMGVRMMMRRKRMRKRRRMIIRKKRTFVILLSVPSGCRVRLSVFFNTFLNFFCLLLKIVYIPSTPKVQ